MLNLLWIGLAGGIGSITRYFTSGLALRMFGMAYPYGTLSVNVVGSFLMALIVELSLSSSAISPALRLTLTTGFLGGFTTYSSFNQETIQQIQSGDYHKAILYILMTVIFCLVAGYLGWGIGKKIIG